MFSGAYLENAAFNPSLSPLHVAIVAAFLSGHSAETFTRVDVVQLQESIVDHGLAARQLMAHVAPSASMHTTLAKTTG